MSKEFAIVLAIVFALLGGVFFVTKKDKSTTNGTVTTSQIGSTNQFGKADSKVTLTEFGDFQCPACGQYYPIVKSIKEEYKDKVNFEFKNFPLVQIHPNAFQASRAAQAAANQGKFWQYHDLLYENQATWKDEKNVSSVFESYATQLSLDTTKFKADVSSEQTANLINADVKKAQSLGATGTPTFAINGKKIDSPKSADGFKKLLDEALANNK